MNRAQLEQIKVTDDFRLGEFYVSRDHPAVAMNMEITVEDSISIARLCSTVIQPIRDHVGHPVNVLNGKRDDLLNRLVGGSETSQHKLAEAGDLDLVADEAWDVFKWLLAEKWEDVGQCIVYLTESLIPRFLHVAVPSLRGSTKPAGDFRVKMSENPTYFKYGIDVIPGL